MKKPKERRKGYCKKCDDYFYIEDHHILPKAKFGRKGKTIALCPKCHAHIHEYMKMNLSDPNNEEEVLKTWDKWFYTVKVIVTVFILGVIVYAIL